MPWALMALALALVVGARHHDVAHLDDRLPGGLIGGQRPSQTEEEDEDAADDEDEDAC